ncbi:hypothetical protein DPMN_006439 [Dreissena polymorpha]|uniref:Uncharacterized protein n=1 Tax=Dreissena polymorpha TaxID=45954 RepID=A0A9D4MVA6_DREPO|nr:hypothetical protein DPMN_006439 [Dreissena polymorpha]
MPTGLLGNPVWTMLTEFPWLDDSSMAAFPKLDNFSGTIPTGFLGNPVRTMPTEFP